MPNWTPRFGETRQREYARTNDRARRLRRDMTSTEQRAWKMLRAFNRDGAHFRRQVAIDDRVFDFGDFGARVLIEVDGGIHDEPDVALRDAHKNALAEGAGFRLLRIRNAEIWGNEDAGYAIVAAFLSAPHPLTPSPPRGGGN